MLFKEAIDAEIVKLETEAKAVVAAGEVKLAALLAGHADQVTALKAEVAADVAKAKDAVDAVRVHITSFGAWLHQEVTVAEAAISTFFARFK